MLKLITLTILLTAVALASARLESRAKQSFHCETELNQQIEMEFNAAHTYLSAASYFASDRVALKGFAKFFEESYKEELEHGQKMIEYALHRGAHVSTPQVAKANDNQWESLNVCEIVNNTLILEKSVNDNLHKLHECGDGNGSTERPDPSFQDFLESNFLSEQFEANKELADLLTRLERATLGSSPACNGLGLHIIDKELQ